MTATLPTTAPAAGASPDAELLVPLAGYCAVCERPVDGMLIRRADRLIRHRYSSAVCPVPHPVPAPPTPSRLVPPDTADLDRRLLDVLGDGRPRSTAQLRHAAGIATYQRTYARLCSLLRGGRVRRLRASKRDGGQWLWWAVPQPKGGGAR